MRSFPVRSLLRQTVWIVLAAQLLCAVLLSGAALLHERRMRLHAFDITLRGRSDSLLGAIQDAEDPDDNVIIDPAELRLPPDDVYAVYNQGGRLIGTSAASPALLTIRSVDGFHEVSVGHTRYRVFQREAMRVIDRAENHGIGLKRPVTILYASPEDHLWHQIFEAVRFYLIAITLAAIVTVALVTILVTSALAPLQELATAAEQLAPPAFAFAPPPSVTRIRELRPLAIVLAESIERMRVAFARQHRFVGDAAHELKTAVAVVRSSIQLLMLRRRTPAEYEQGLDRVLEDNERVETLIAQMLQLASLEEAPAADSPIGNIAEVATNVLEQLKPYAEQRAIALRLLAPRPVYLRLKPDRARRAYLKPRHERNPAQYRRADGRGYNRRHGAAERVPPGARHGIGHCAGRPASRLRPLLQGRRFAIEADRWYRSRSGHLQVNRRNRRRKDRP